MSDAQYKRILLKLSGEALMGDGEYGIETAMVNRIARDIKEVVDKGVDVSVVVGAGNIFRGVSGAAEGMDRSTADYMGMLATVMNALALQNALEKIDVDTRVQSAIGMNVVCERYIRRRAIRHMEKGRVVIFGAGTGNPFFTTDTAATLRASEMNCDVLIKATKVDGIYDSDPMKNPDAKHLSELTYMDVLSQELNVMDAAAIALAKDNNIPILVFSLKEEGGFAKVVKGEGKFTLVKN